MIYDMFYKKFGVMSSAKMADPKINDTRYIVLPKSSVGYFLPLDTTMIGPSMDDLFIRHYEDRIMVEHITTLYQPDGNVRPMSGANPAVMIKDYHRKYRKLRPLHQYASSTRNDRLLPIINAGMLLKLYRYGVKKISAFHEYQNVFKTVIMRMHNLMRIDDRQHFLHMEVPKRLVGPTTLRKSAVMDDLSVDKQANFHTMEMIVVREVFLALGENNQSSLFSLFSADMLSRINIIFHTGDAFSMINLGRILKADNDDKDGTRQHQNRFLSMLIRLSEQNTASVHTTQHDTDGDEEEDNGAHTELTDVEGNEGLTDEEVIEKDIARLDELEEKVEDSKSGYEKRDTEVGPKSGYNKVNSRLDILAANGEISAAQHRRLTSLNEKSLEMDNPFSNEPINEWRQLTEDDLTVTEDDIKLPTSKFAVDKSQGKATLDAIDKKYREKVLKKDIVNSIFALNDVGYIVNGIETERVETVTDDYTIFRVNVTSIKGSPSTLPFRIPNLDDEGYFTAGGVKYRHSQQQVDIPIRKTSPFEVALTSYAAKLFVRRSQRVVMDYSKWLIRHIDKLSLGDKPPITDIVPGNVFTSKVKLPRVYTALSGTYKSFTVNGMVLNFDYDHRVQTFGDLVTKVEKKHGGVVVGKKGKSLIVLTGDQFGMVKDDGIESLGLIENIIGVDPASRPVEIAEMDMYGKSTPLIFLLAMSYGIDELIDLTKADTRQTDPGSQMNLTEDEFVVRFKDTTLIVNRANPIAAMIFGGLNRYHKSMKRYEYNTFNSKDAWLNVLSENGMRIGAIREINFMVDGFIDPITRDLLIQMKEPSEFNRLLLRAVELITTDEHPDEMDTLSMRMRGPERMAGILYNKLWESVRMSLSRGVGENTKLEINPEEVWMAIQKDSSVSLVEELNPVEQIRQRELVTFSGYGGRSAQAMVERTRVFHKNSIGVVSEGGVDSGKVGINSYLSSNPKLLNVRGVIDPNKEGLEPSNYFSTAGMLSPFTDTED